MLLVPQARQRGAQQATAAEIERRARLKLGQPLRFPLAVGQAAEIDERERLRGGRGDRLVALAGGAPETRTQGLMAPGDGGEGRRHGRGIHRPVEKQGRGEQVGRTPGLQLVEEPEPLLGEGERQLAVAGHRLKRRRRRDPGPTGRRHPAGQPGHGRRLEDQTQRYFDAEDLADPREQPRAQQRMTAEGEEILVGSHPLAAEKLAPDPGHDLFLHPPRRRHRLNRLRLGLRQRAAIELAGAGQRQGREKNPGRRHHVVRQPGGEEFAQLALRGPPGRRRHHPGG